MKELGQVCKLFGDRYCNNTATVAFTKESIQPILEAKMDDEEDDEDNEKSSEGNNKASSAAKQAASGTLVRKSKSAADSISTLEFLNDIANALHAEQLEVSIDYLMFHRVCWRLLRQVNEACKPKLLEMFGGGYLDKEYQLPFTVGYIFMAATTTSRVQICFCQGGRRR